MVDEVEKLGGKEPKSQQQMILENDFHLPLGKDGNFSARVKPKFTNPEAKASFRRMIEHVSKEQAGDPTKKIALHYSGREILGLDKDTKPTEITEAIRKAQKSSHRIDPRDHTTIRRRNANIARSLGL